jgi:hypothetical protein
MDKIVAHLQGKMTMIARDTLPKLVFLLEDTRNIVTRLMVLVEPTLHDNWVCNFPSVPSPPVYV